MPAPVSPRPPSLLDQDLERLEACLDMLKRRLDDPLAPELRADLQHLLDDSYRLRTRLKVWLAARPG